MVAHRLDTEHEPVRNLLIAAVLREQAQPRVRVLIANGLYSLVPASSSVPLTLLGDTMYVVLVICTMICIIYVKRSPAHWFLILWPVYGTMMAAASLGHPRLRIPFEVSLLVLGSYPLAHPRQTFGRIRRGSIRRDLLMGGAISTFLLLISSSVYIPFFRSQAHLAAASIWQATHNPQRSMTATEAAVKAHRGTALPLLALAERQFVMGDPQSLATWQQLVKLDPAILEAQALLLREALRNEDAAEIAVRLEAIHTIRRDDDRLYGWLWDQNVRRPQPDLDIGSSADLGLIHGVSQAHTKNGTSFRWMEGQAQIRMPPGPAMW